MINKDYEIIDQVLTAAYEGTITPEKAQLGIENAIANSENGLQDHLGSYIDKKFTDGEVSDKLEAGSVLEQTLAYATGQVDENIAYQRADDASKLERGLIATYHQEVVAEKKKEGNPIVLDPSPEPAYVET